MNKPIHGTTVATPFNPGKIVSEEQLAIAVGAYMERNPVKVPVKGEDYYTEEDKDEMVAAVLAELPTWEGGSY